MCSIVGLFDLKESPDVLREKALAASRRLRHRGPDWSGIYSDEKTILVHERLAIVDVETGAQPLIDLQNGNVLAVNGEIYNHKLLEKELINSHQFQTKSDCEVLLYLYDEFGPEFVNQLNGIFAFALYDKKKGDFYVARDHMGIIPLYYGWDENQTFYVASELKALVDICKTIKEFPPGHYYMASTGEFVKYYQPEWAEDGFMPSNSYSPEKLRQALEEAVHRQLMCDVPYGLLLSGGLDSSVLSAIAARFSKNRVEDDDQGEAWWPRLHSFSVGLEGSPDLVAAKKVADYIGTVHHEIKFTLQEGVDAVRDVIYQLETFDVTTIRSATPMFLMSRKIKAMGIKMVLSGEGADELFGGYLYFHKAPNGKEFHEETVRKLFKLHQYDCLRANKSTAAWGVEARVPFLDKEFMEHAMMLDPSDKMIRDQRMEKWVIRKAFEGYLPDEILWRQKEQFSDGVGYGWIDRLKDYAEQEVSDSQMDNADRRFSRKVPMSKEEYLYRSIFEELFSNPSAVDCVPSEKSVACSTPTALKWDAAFESMADPSGRAVAGVHQDSYK